MNWGHLEKAEGPFFCMIFTYASMCTSATYQSISNLSALADVIGCIVTSPQKSQPFAKLVAQKFEMSSKLEPIMLVLCLLPADVPVDT